MSFEKSLDNILEYMMYDVNRVRDASRFEKLPMSFFSGAMPFIDLDSWGDVDKEQKDRLIWSEVEPEYLEKMSSVIFGKGSDDKGHKYNLFSIQRPTLKEIRGKFKISSRHHVRCRRALMYDDGTYRSYTEYLSYIDRRWLIVYSGKAVAQPHFDPQMDAMIKVAHGVAWERYFNWHIELGYPSHPSIVLPTDAIGVSEVFKLRDVPEGKKRRTAIRNWIKEHWRMKRQDAPIEKKVREHLRGSTRFIWNDLICTLHPSEMDIDKQGRLIKKRNEEREKGTDRRVRV